MINKASTYLQKHGLVRLIIKIINSLLNRLFKFQVVRSSNIDTKIAKKIFGKSKLVKSDNGYWYLDPMPSENDLNEYYDSLYWDSRNGKDSGASIRDFLHFQMLNELVPASISKDNCLLNFGAGHGGLSHMAWSIGMDVVNVEPSNLPTYYEERWQTFLSIKSVLSNSVDIMYGSHSLEHVQDIDEFMFDVKRVLKPNGTIFWEVPNGKYQTNGPPTGEIVIPHTYYFTTSFFENCFDEIILNECFDKSHRLGKIQSWADLKNDEGPVIRTIGKISK